MKANDIIESVVADLVAQIEAGAGEWRMPWRKLAATPLNVDGRPYRGMNSLILAMVAADRGWSSHRWATYKGWQRHGAQVRKGEKSTPVLLWKPTKRKVQADDGSVETRQSLYATSFNVFSAEQVDGAEEYLTPVELDPVERIDAAEAFFAAVGTTVIEGGDRACYVPAVDEIRMPTIDQFDDAEKFYATLAHEHTHWTGHPDRLDRDLSGRFGSDAYAVEELIAEMGAAFWCAQAGIGSADRSDHAAYLASWVRVLREQPKVLVTVCSKAQAALDHLNGHQANGQEEAA